jgi:hypothetical protein
MHANNHQHDIIVDSVSIPRGELPEFIFLGFISLQELLGFIN